MAMLVCRRAAAWRPRAVAAGAWRDSVRQGRRWATGDRDNNGGGGGSGNDTTAGGSRWDAFWRWTTQRRPEHPRMSTPWILEKLLICTVFAIAGTTSLKLIRPCLGKVGIEGSLVDGPWSYRFASLFCVTPFYTLILLTVGTLSGRHPVFAKVAARMWGRLMPYSVRYRLVCPAGRVAMDKKRAGQ